MYVGRVMLRPELESASLVACCIGLWSSQSSKSRCGKSRMIVVGPWCGASEGEGA